jgi:ABC-type Fe3+/spermidine/putrescine transport system ATPase subunit
MTESSMVFQNYALYPHMSVYDIWVSCSRPEKGQPFSCREAGGTLDVSDGGGWHGLEDDSAVIKIFPGVNLPRPQ